MKSIVKLVVVLIVSLVSYQTEAQEIYDITVTVEKANSNEGKMFIALYNTKAGFLKTTYKAVKSEITNHQCSIVFEDIPKGTYAVSVFHDENNNGKMDTNFFGIPKEDYGCSNGATGFMGPPKWDDAKFQMTTDNKIRITL